eukprot:gene4381-14506_t
MFEAVMSTPIASDSTRDKITHLMNLVEEETMDINSLETGLVKDIKAMMMPDKKLKFKRDLDVSDAVQLYMRNAISGQTDALLNACRLGDTDGIERLIEQEVNLDSMDYDQRTGLENANGATVDRFGEGSRKSRKARLLDFTKPWRAS